VLRALRPGRSEVDVAARLEYAARRAGAERMSFETIVASGPRSALPHGVASDALLPKLGLVVLDYGVILHGYCSDMTRTVHMGKPSRQERDWYRAVLEAQLAAISVVSPGAKLSEVDKAARSVLKRSKLEKFFTHSTGHGVGLEIHEPPRVAANQDGTLKPGHQPWLRAFDARQKRFGGSLKGGCIGIPHLLTTTDMEHRCFKTA
jgi:Xaa-Pro aminopeptidase